MAEVEVFKQITRDFADVADFITIYIREAHPTDGWVLGGNKKNISQPKTMDERIAAADILLYMDITCPILIDTINNQACQLYASLPERLYIFHKDTIVYIGGKGPDDYRLNEVRDWLTIYKKQK